jgi:hypothetical protein
MQAPEQNILSEGLFLFSFPQNGMMREAEIKQVIQQ